MDPIYPSQNQEPGLRCVKCGNRKFRVIYTRARLKGVIRRRECRNCKSRITTKETTIGGG
jgi:transcriptional regulator NrdR family protein